MLHKIFITGATGFIGREVVTLLRDRGHAVTALIRAGSESKLPAGVRAIAGDPLDGASLKAALGDCDTWIQLIGTPRPTPAKAAEFRAVDRRSVMASLEALPGSSIGHYIYLSVAQPAPIMQAYVDVREECETRLRRTGLPVTFLRPWYVLGPGRRWPSPLIPFYRVAEFIPGLREKALRLGFVDLSQMARALVHAVENPPQPGKPRILGVPEIRKASL